MNFKLIIAFKLLENHLLENQYFDLSFHYQSKNYSTQFVKLSNEWIRCLMKLNFELINHLKFIMNRLIE